MVGGRNEACVPTCELELRQAGLGASLRAVRELCAQVMTQVRAAVPRREGVLCGHVLDC